MRSLAAAGGIAVEQMIGIYCGSRTDSFDDVRIWPVEKFVKALHAGEIF
jgi:hypothetical protein